MLSREQRGHWVGSFFPPHHSPVVGLLLGHCSSGRKSNAFFWSYSSRLIFHLLLLRFYKVMSLLQGFQESHSRWLPGAWWTKGVQRSPGPGCGGCHVPASHTSCGPQNPGAAPSLPPCLMIVAKKDVCLLRYWNRWSLTAWGHWEAWRDPVQKVLSSFPKKPSGFYLSALFAFCFWEAREAVVGRGLATHCSSYLVWRQGS